MCYIRCLVISKKFTCIFPYALQYAAGNKKCAGNFVVIVNVDREVLVHKMF